MPWTAPIGSVEERATGIIWPGRWIDATPYDTKYALGYHTGADLNLNFPSWDADRHSDVVAIGPGKVTYAKVYSTSVWGGIVVIDHGTVDGEPLFSRYGHVENIRVSVDQEVQAGQRIAAVGNGEGLFPYHLHFDISKTDVLLDRPGHWPGHNQTLVRTHYVDPKAWLRAHVGVGVVDVDVDVDVDADADAKVVIPPTHRWFVIATLGLRVRDTPGLSGLQVGVLTYGTKISIEDESFVEKDSYRWGRIQRGMHNGDWVALGKADGSQEFLSQNKPG
jgi:hypothetical protein